MQWLFHFHALKTQENRPSWTLRKSLFRPWISNYPLRSDTRVHYPYHKWPTLITARSCSDLACEAHAVEFTKLTSNLWCRLEQNKQTLSKVDVKHVTKVWRYAFHTFFVFSRECMYIPTFPPNTQQKKWLIKRPLSWKYLETSKSFHKLLPQNSGECEMVLVLFLPHISRKESS